MKKQLPEEEVKQSTKVQQSEEEVRQQQSFLKEQAKYWKTFVHDLFVGTFKRMLFSPLVFGMAFWAIAYLIYKLSIKPQAVFILLKMLEVLILFLLYFLIGIFSGLLYGANATLLKKAEELENGIHLIINPLMAAIIKKMPGGQKSISINEFDTLLNDQIRRFKKTSRSQFRFLSLVGAFSRFFLRMTLRILRYILLHDFLDELREKEETQLNAKTVETYYREKLVANIVGRFTGNLELVQYAVYAVLVIFLGIPVAFMVIF